MTHVSSHRPESQTIPSLQRRGKATNAMLPFHQEEIEQSVPARFARVVSQIPERIAIKVSTHALTYDALDKASNRLAQAILALQGQGEEPVALCVEHGIAPIVAIFGILKAGKFYVALNPSDPHPRLIDILEDVHSSLMITNHKNFSLTHELSQNRHYVINMDELDALYSEEHVPLSLAPDTLAAIFYTSGSTGKPKGLMRTHRNVLHFAWKDASDYHICTDDHRSLLFSCDFGASTSDIFGTLLNGATLYPYNIRVVGLDRLADWLTHEEITVFNPPVVLFRQFLNTLPERKYFPKPRLIFLAGQTVYLQDIEQARKHFSANCIFLHRLAVSEAGVVAHFFIDQQTELPGNTVPVGHVIEDKEVLLLDEADQELGLNEVGEIAVRSRYLSPGYWRDPELTRQKFLPDPEGGDKRIYLTGDLGRMRPDGCLEYLGRKDFQVKIRGYRVQMTAIEGALNALDSIKEAVVMAREKASGDNYLVAYVVPACQPVPTVSELRQALAMTLPEYMIPSTFMLLEKLPSTPTGKVDRQALPIPDQTRPVLDTAFVSPRNDVEQQLTEIWQQVLGIHSIGIHDNFFDLGGNSLLAGKVLVELTNAMGVYLPMIAIFQAPTIEQLAEKIRHKQESLSFFSLIPIQTQGTLPPLFFVYPLGRALRHSVQGTHKLAEYLGNTQPIYGLRYGLAHTQDLDQLPLPPCQIEDLATHYIQEMRQIQAEGPYFLCGRSGGGLIAFEMACQLHQQGHKIGILVVLDAFHPLRYKYRPRAFTKRLTYYATDFFMSPYRGIVAQCRSILYFYLTGNRTKRRWKWLEFPALGRFVWRIQRLNFYVRHQMRYDPKVYSGRVTLFESAIQDGPCESRWGWEPFAAGGLEIITVPGHHSNMMEEEVNLTAMAEALQTCLAEARKNLELNPIPPRESGVE